MGFDSIRIRSLGKVGICQVLAFFVAVVAVLAAGDLVQDLRSPTWRAGLGDWPIGVRTDALRPVEARVGGIRQVGSIRLEGAPTGYDHELQAAELRKAVTPTWILNHRAPISIVQLGHERDPKHVRQLLEAQGFSHTWVSPGLGLAIASESEPILALPPRPEVTGPGHVGAMLLLALLSLVPACAAARPRVRDSLSVRRFFLTLIAVPFALSAAAALGDAVPKPYFPEPATITALIYASFIGAWCMLVRGLHPKGAVTPQTSPAVSGHLAPKDNTHFWLAVTAAVLLASITIVLRFGFRPEGMIDAIAMYDMRARAIVLDPLFLSPFQPASGVHTLHPDYPPAVPFALAGGYRLTGTFSVIVPMWLQLCVWIGGAGVAFDWARRTTGRTAALFTLALLVTLPHFQYRISDLCCDVVLGLTFMAALTVWHADRTPTPRAAATTGLLLGMVLLTKQEGTLFLLVWLAAQVLFSWRSLRAHPKAAAALLLGLTPAVILSAAFALQVPSSDLLGQLHLRNATWPRFIESLKWFWKTIASPFHYAWVFPAAAAALAFVLRPRQANPLPLSAPIKATAVTLATVAFGFCVIYQLVGYEATWLLRTSCDRLFTQLFPATVLLSVALAKHAMRSTEAVVVMQPKESSRWSPIRPATHPAPAPSRRASTRVGRARVRESR